MGAKRNASITGEAIASLIPSFAISQEQIDAATQPAHGTPEVFASRVEARRVVGRPWHVWKNDPELARVVNDRLAAGAGS